MKSYKANWEILGLPGNEILTPGAIVMLEEEVAARLIKGGSLSPCAEIERKDLGNPPAGTIDKGVDLSGMSKAQLVEYAHAKLGLTLDINKKKDDLLVAIAEAAGK